MTTKMTTLACAAAAAAALVVGAAAYRGKGGRSLENAAGAPRAAGATSAAALRPGLTASARQQPAVEQLGAPRVVDHEPELVGDPDVHPGDLVPSPAPLVDVRESPLMANLGPGGADALIRQRALYGDDALPAALIEEPSPATVAPVLYDESYDTGDALVLAPDDAVHLAGRPLSFTVQLTRGGAPAPLAQGTATIVGADPAQHTACVARDDGLVQCTFEQPPAGMLTVSASVTRPDGEMHFGLMPVRVVVGLISLTGDFEARREGDDRVVGVGLTTSAAATVRVEGRLYDAQNRLVGWARARAELGVGADRVALRFDARMFHESDFAAPFHLGDVAVFLESGDSAPQLQAVATAIDLVIE